MLHAVLVYPSPFMNSSSLLDNNSNMPGTENPVAMLLSKSLHRAHPVDIKGNLPSPPVASPVTVHASSRIER